MCAECGDTLKRKKRKSEAGQRSFLTPGSLRAAAH